MRLFNGSDLVIYFFLYAFAAWVLETLLYSLQWHRFVNCGIWDLPLLISHGALMVILIMANSSGLSINSAFLFILIQTMIIGYLSEFFTEWVLRARTGSVKKIRCQANFRMRLLQALGLSLIYAALYTVVQPVLFSLVSLLPLLAVRIIALVLGLLLLVDVILVTMLAKYRPREEQNFLWEHKLQLGERLSRHLWERVYRVYPSLRRVKEGGMAEADRELRAQGVVFAQGISFEKMVWMLFLCALLGDWIETIYVFATAGVWMRRSSLVLGPFSIVRGLGAVVLTLVLSRIEKQNIPSTFVVGFFFGGAFEYLCSVFTEAVFGMKFWDYSHMPLNIDGRTNVLFMIFWGLLAVGWRRFAYPPISRQIEKIPPMLGLMLSWGIAIFLACDMAVTAAVMVRATLRLKRPQADNAIEEFIDRYYPESRLKQLWPNMTFLTE